MLHALGPTSLQVTRIVSYINIFLDIFGNSLNIIILIRPNLYRNTSAHYFLALAINNLFVSTFILVIRLLGRGYQTDLRLSSLSACKFLSYLSDLCALLSAYYIVLASFDRFCISSLNANRRRWSNIKTCKWFILLTIILFGILCINTAILTDLNIDYNPACGIQPKSIYHQFYLIYRLVILTTLAPGLMIFFGLLAVYHTKQVHVRQVHTTNHRRTDRQLTLMLFIQVAIFIILSLPIFMFDIIVAFSSMENLTSTMLFLRPILELLQEFTYTTPFFLYIISGQIFRQELQKILSYRRNHSINPIDNARRSIPLVIVTRTS